MEKNVELNYQTTIKINFKYSFWLNTKCSKESLTHNKVETNNSIDNFNLSFVHSSEQYNNNNYYYMFIVVLIFCNFHNLEA